MPAANRPRPKAPDADPQRQLTELQRSAEHLPGVADLIHLYQQHARTMHQAGAFLGQVEKRIIITSGASSV